MGPHVVDDVALLLEAPCTTLKVANDPLISPIGVSVLLDFNGVL